MIAFDVAAILAVSLTLLGALVIAVACVSIAGVSYLGSRHARSIELARTRRWLAGSSLVSQNELVAYSSVSGGE